MEANTDKKQSLQEMLVTKNLILDTIYENYGEIEEEQVSQLQELDINMPVKVDAWAWVLKKDGGIDKDIELLKERKDSISAMISRLEQGKQRMKTYLHRVLENNKLERVDGNEFWIKKTFAKSSSVDVEKVEPEYKTYQLPKLTYTEYRIIIDLLGQLKSHNGSLSLISKILEDTQSYCGVKELPEGYDAIKVELSESVRVYSK